MNVFVYATAEEAARACAEALRQRVEEALADRGAARVALSGGSTPKLLFAAMREMEARWRETDWFWVDERCVGPEDEQSNYGMAAREFLDRVAAPPERIHRVRGELPPEEAAARYEEEIRAAFGGADPEFDVMQLGLGADAHTASLFPGEAAIERRTGIAAAVYAEKLKQWRVTLLPGVIFGARARLALAAGKDKAEALRRITNEALDPRRLPGQLLLAPDAPSLFYLDKAAAEGLA